MAEWHHWWNGHELGSTLGDGEGQGGLACCSPWSCKELNITGLLNHNNKHCIMSGQQKNNVILYHQKYHLLEKSVITFWNPNASQNYLGIFWKMTRYCFFLQSHRFVFNVQPYLKTTALYDDLLLLSSLFHFFCFIFSIPISLVYVV